MDLKINGQIIAAKPYQFSVTVLDLDDADATVRTANGTFNRDRVAVKRQIDMTFNPLPWKTASALLKQMKDSFFQVYYPDVMTGEYETKTFYVGDRPAPVAISRDDGIWWGQIQITLTEQ
ncbi:hypothetical protein D3P07_11595 [Paenibacillus sp. 1011MAR3C5]|uniref:DUF6711 family protein n=1 Tax=Paenibacillus sp. 1011MAR3C5 TaxID=1675787 RepID=UPI000E6B73B7|nr:DUF6711 family protein [Paenibacillus sp. 1011MAR3C5]RJE88630.1 hypothetical protein D3P07_11595 [Paenibacillus sp. 1011MAR3C5]